MGEQAHNFTPFFKIAINYLCFSTYDFAIEENERNRKWSKDSR